MRKVDSCEWIVGGKEAPPSNSAGIASCGQPAQFFEESQGGGAEVQGLWEAPYGGPRASHQQVIGNQPRPTADHGQTSGGLATPTFGHQLNTGSIRTFYGGGMQQQTVILQEYLAQNWIKHQRHDALDRTLGWFHLV